MHGVMRRSRSQGDRQHKSLTQRLDHAVSRINPFLLAIVIGLAVLDATCFAAMLIRLPVTRCVLTSPVSVVSEVNLN